MSKRYEVVQTDHHVVLRDRFTGDSLRPADLGGSRLLAHRVCEMLNAAEDAKSAKEARRAA